MFARAPIAAPLVSVQGPLPSNQPHPTSAASSSRFQTLTTDKDVEEAKKKAIPKNTDKNIRMCGNNGVLIDVKYVLHTVTGQPT